MKVVVDICVGTACHLLGSQDLFAVIDTVPEQQRQWIELYEMECLPCCGKGPNVQINGKVHSQVTPDRLTGLIMEALERRE